MKRTVLGVLVGLVILTASAAARPGADELVPADVVIYGELNRDAIERVLHTMASPPAYGLAMPQMASRFAIVDQLLGLPVGTFDQAAPRAQRIAAGLTSGAPFLIASFDSAEPTSALLEAGTEEAEGVVSFRAGVAAFARGNRLFVSSRQVCRRLAKGDFVPLSESPKFRAARQSFEKAPVWAYANVPELLQTLHEMAPDRAKMDRTLTAFGLKQAPWALLTMERESAKSGTLRAMLKLGEDPSGWLGLIPESPRRPPALVPSSNAAVVALNWGDPVAFYQRLRKQLSHIEQRAGTRAFTRQLAMLEQMLGINLEQFFSYLGSGAALYLRPPGEDHMLKRADVTVVLHLQEPEQFHNALNRALTNAAGAPMKRTDEGDTSMYRLGAPPAWAEFTHDRAVFAANSEGVRQYRQWRGAEQPEAARDYLPAGAVAARLDLGLLMDNYPAAEPGTKLVLRLTREGTDVHLAAGYRDYRGGGMRTLMHTYSSFAAAIYTMGRAAGTQPARGPMGRARRQAQRAASASNLHNIGLGLAMYRQGHQGRFPSELEDLIEAGFLDTAEVFIDPTDQNPRVRGGRGLRYSYRYPGALPADVPPNMIVCYSRKGIYPEGRNVLYVDQRVEFVDESELTSPGGAQGMSLPECYRWLIEHHGEVLSDEQKARFKEFYEVE
ncbi:MAG: hypothetical protein ACOC7T_00575 [Planctomycetota bacterium]